MVNDDEDDDNGDDDDDDDDGDGDDGLVTMVTIPCFTKLVGFYWRYVLLLSKNVVIVVFVLVSSRNYVALFEATQLLLREKF